MKKRLLLVAVLLSAISYSAVAQKVKIGNTEIYIQSPLKVEKESEIIEYCQDEPKRYSPRIIDEFYFGMGVSVNAGPASTPLAQFGGCMDLMTGFKYFYRPVSWFAIGTQVQYSYNSYRVDGAVDAGWLGEDVVLPTKTRAEYFRSDNIGTALLFRIYPCRKVRFEFGGWGDYAMSKRIVVKADRKYKYWDNRRFAPMRVGLQASIGVGDWSVYAKYRVSDLFFHDYIKGGELPRLNIGAMLTF